MRTALAITFSTIFAICSYAAEGRPVSYRSGDETVNAVLYAPKGNGPFPALITVHEWWGLNDWVKEQASKLADQGYETLAVDLYRGKVAKDPSEAHELMRGVPEDRSKRDLKAAFDYMKERKDVDAKRIGVIGWCMGGGYALDLALAEPKLAAAVINYGHLATDPAALKKIRAPMLGIFGAQDRGIPVDDVHNFERQMKKLGKKIDVVIYPEAGHAFENPSNKEGYREGDAANAWETTLKFLDAHLKTGSTSVKGTAKDDDGDIDDIQLDDKKVPTLTTHLHVDESKINGLGVPV